MMMKKIYTLFLLLGCLFVATACSDDDENEAVPVLEVVKSEVTFDAKAGTGTIEVKSTAPLKAESSESWCAVSVSGNVVTVSVPALTELSSRSALVTITDGTASVEVPVHQAGSIWNLRGEEAYLKGKGESVISIPAKITCEYTVSASDSWITGTMKEGEYVVTLAPNNGSYRQGTLTFEGSEGQKKVYTFSQMGVEGFAGNYTAIWQAYNDDDELAWFQNTEVVLAPAEDDADTYAIENLWYYPFPLVYNEANDNLTIANASRLGELTLNTADGPLTVYAYVIVAGTRASDGAGLINYATSSTYASTFVYGLNEDNQLEISFIDSGKWTGVAMTGFYAFAFSEDRVSSSTRLGWLDMFQSLTLVKN